MLQVGMWQYRLSATRAGRSPAAHGVSGPSTGKGQMQPSLPLRPITTHINLLVVGASRSGKGDFIQSFEDALGLTPMPAGEQPPAGADTSAQLRNASDPWGAFNAAPGAWRTTYQPLLVPGAGRELVYSVQSAPGWGATLDPAAWLEALVGLVLAARQEDYKDLAGARGLHKSLVCGALAHSYTAALYFLPPTGPTATDLVLMAALSQTIQVLPVVGSCWTAPGGQGEAAAVAQLMAEVEQLLAAPGELVPGLRAGDIQLPSKPAVQPLWMGSTAGSATAGSNGGGGDPISNSSATPVSPLTTNTHMAQASASLDVISLSSEEDLPGSPPTTATGGAFAGTTEPDAGSRSTDGRDMASAFTGDGLQKMLQLLAGSEVYCLLDASWDAYTSFCTAYEAADRQLAPLVAKALRLFTPGLLTGPGAVKALQVQLERTQAELHKEREAHKETWYRLESINDADGLFMDQLREAQAKALKMEAVAKELAKALSRYTVKGIQYGPQTGPFSHLKMTWQLGPEATALVDQMRSSVKASVS